MIANPVNARNTQITVLVSISAKMGPWVVTASAGLCPYLCPYFTRRPATAATSAMFCCRYFMVAPTAVHRMTFMPQTVFRLLGASQFRSPDARNRGRGRLAILPLFWAFSNCLATVLSRLRPDCPAEES
jgi:hypothetical protein